MVFRPYTGVIPEFCTTSWVGTSTPLSWGFILPRHRSTPFGSPSNDSRRTHRGPHTPKGAATGRFPYGYPLNTVNLAIGQNSLVLFSKSTAERCSTAERLRRLHAPHTCPYLHSGLCTSRQGYFSTFPHGTTTLSVSGRVQGWRLMPPAFTRDF